MTRLENVLDWTVSKNRFTIEMVYLPTLSVNRYKTVRGITRREVKQWMNELAFLLSVAVKSNLCKNFKRPVKITLAGVFKDNRHPDVHNLAKPILDAIQAGLGIDDKHYSLVVGQAQIGGEPRIIITIEDAPDD